MRYSVSFLMLLLGPTLLLGLVALVFLHREVDRMEQQREDLRSAKIQSLQQVAASSAANVRLNFEEVREGFRENLQTLDREGLLSLPEANPLVAEAWFWEVGAEFPEGTRAEWVPEKTPWEGAPTRKSPGETEQVGGELREEASEVSTDEELSLGLVEDSYVVANVETRRQLNVLSRQQAPVRQAPKPTPAPATPRARGFADAPEESLGDLLLEESDVVAVEEESLAEGGWMWSTRNGERQYLGWWRESPDAGVKLVSLDLEVLRRELSALLPRQEGRVEWYLAHSAYVPWEKSVRTEGYLEGQASPGGDLATWQIRFFAPPPEAAYSPGLVRWFGSFLLLGVMASIGLGGVLLQRQSTQATREARRKTNFVANVSHELRTPLSSIRLYAEMLGEKQRSETQLVRYSGVLQRESARLERLVDNLLQLTKEENGKAPPVKGTIIDLIAWLQEFAVQKKAEVEAAGMALEVQSRADSLNIVTDPGILRQILENLLENALKYAASGQSLALIASDEGEAWRITVADRGPGVAREFQARMFDRFTRGDESLEQSQGGLGIGLSIAREMGQRIGVDLFYEDRPGGGSQFILQSCDYEKSPFSSGG